MKLFLQKNAKFSSAGGSAPKPPASDGWGLRPVADLGGGCIPPTSLKVTILAEKLACISNNSAPFRDASPPTDLNVTNPAKNQSQFW